MNNDAPQTLDAAGSRVAELEQQLRLSDEGVSRLAQRCLELEQQVLKYEAVLASQGADTEQGALLLPQLFYDSGSGFSPHECLTVAPDSYDELTHEVSAVFELPVEARALRLDPGEFACCITDFSLSDERLSYHILNGNALQEGTMLFMNIDPNLTVESAVGFPAGLRFAVKYRYYPLGRYLHEQPGKALLRALTVLKEMIDPLVLEMVERHQVTDSVSLQVGYSRDVHGSAGGTCRLDGFTDSAKKIRRAFVAYFRQIVNPNYPIRRLGVGLNNLQDAEYARLDLFTDLTAEKREHDLQRTVIDLRRRFGKNAVLHGLSLGEKATARRRNRLIGGHNSGEEQPKH